MKPAADAMAEVAKVSTHSFYSSPTASQLAAVRALDGRGDAWVREMRDRYRESGEAARMLMASTRACSTVQTCR